MSTKALESHLKPLLPFLRQNGVTDICVNRPHEVFVEADRHFAQHPVDGLCFGHLLALAYLIAEFNQQEISAQKPLLSASLPSGERVQIVLPPACEKNKIALAIRRPYLKGLALNDYARQGAFGAVAPSQATASMAAADQDLLALYQARDFQGFLEHAILSKKNILISAGTGVGKTTFLNACLKAVPANERIITLEDTREVALPQPNAVHLLASKGQQGAAKITMQDLLEGTLRLRPDRILLSEIRGDEALAFLRAVRSGHPGSLSTVHASSPWEALEQLALMLQQAGNRFPYDILMQYVQSTVPIIVQLARCPAKPFVKIAEIYFGQAVKHGV